MNNSIVMVFGVPAVLLSVFLSVSVFAQYGESNAYSLYADKEHPSPGEKIQIFVESGDASTTGIRSVRWYVNGEEREEFANKLSMTEISDSSVKQIVANIIYFDIHNQRRYTQDVRWVRPAVFDILWEGDSVAPTLYRGYKLAGPQTPIRISAKIQYIDRNGDTYTEKDFSFVWEIESRYHDERGPGVSSIVYEEGGTLLNNFIFVRAQATLINDNTVSLEKIINIPVVEPRLLTYPHTLLHGLLSNLVIPQKISLVKQPVTFSVYPYYFSKPDFEKNVIEYKWFVNDGTNHIKEGRKIDVSTEGESSSVLLRIRAKNTHNGLQKEENNFTINL